MESESEIILGSLPQEFRQNSMGVVDCVKRLIKALEDSRQECHEWRNGHRESPHAPSVQEISRLRAALPKTADGVTIVPGMTVFDIVGHEIEPRWLIKIACSRGQCLTPPYYGENDYYEPAEPTQYRSAQCYSTLAAAQSVTSQVK